MEIFCDKPLLGRVPVFKDGVDYSNYYQIILNNLFNLNKNKITLFTSCFANEGKSTTTYHLANLACLEKKIALINADPKTAKETLKKLVVNKPNKLDYFILEDNNLISLINKIIDVYDHIFIDCSPTLENIDSRNLINNVESIVFLITDKHYPCFDIKRGTRNFNDKVIGIIQNKHS